MSRELTVGWAKQACERRPTIVKGRRQKAEGRMWCDIVVFRSAQERPFAERKATLPRGFSLLEVVLALAILTITVAVLGELIRAGLRSAQVARDLSQAELICESTIYKLEAGLLPPQPLAGAAVEEAPGWLYSIVPENTGSPAQAGLFKFRITAEQDPGRFARPTRYSVVRWLRDPSLVLAQQATQQAMLPTSNSTGGSTAGGSTSMGGTGVF